MNHRIVVVAALGLLAAAGQATAQSRSAGVSVGVQVVDGAIRVSTESAAMPAGVSTISWQMQTAGWKFAAGSIDFGEASRHFSCRVFSDGAAISCNRSASAPPGPLAYTIRLSQGGGLVQPPQPNVYISLD